MKNFRLLPILCAFGFAAGGIKSAQAHGHKHKASASRKATIAKDGTVLLPQGATVSLRSAGGTTHYVFYQSNGSVALKVEYDARGHIKVVYISPSVASVSDCLYPVTRISVPYISSYGMPAPQSTSENTSIESIITAVPTTGPLPYPIISDGTGKVKK